MSSQRVVPATPRVISPSPTPSEALENDAEYTAPTTRSAARRRLNGPRPIREEEDDHEGDDSSPSVSRRTSSRSEGASRHRTSKAKTSSSESPVVISKPLSNGSLSPNGHLSPPSPSFSDRWRNLSRSPSPLGLIPLHQNYRTFIHKHEIPRKALHVSIGFLTLDLYRRGIQASAITPWLLSAFIPIAATDLLRHRSSRVNRLYVRSLGALMRESEVSGYNGVIWYLLGAFIVLRFFPKDVGVMGVLLLSWCDTAASTFGRLYGRYTISLRRGKSLAGTLAAWLMGVMTAAAFWGWFVPTIGAFPDDPENAFMFTGHLNLVPDSVRNLIGWNPSDASSGSIITGPLALGVMSVVSGIIAAGSEMIDLFGWDDNITIPVLSGVGLWGFLKVFG